MSQHQDLPEMHASEIDGGDAQSRAKWPTVIGVLSLIYALGGLLCQVAAGTWLVLANQLPEQWRAGITMPPVLRAIGMTQASVTLICGIIMLMGAVKLLGRQRAGVSMLRGWAMARIVLVLLSVVLAILTAPAQIQMQRDAVEWQKRFFKENEITQEVPEYTDEQLWHKAIIGTAVTSAVFAAYPTFVILYLSRKKISSQVELWR